MCDCATGPQRSRTEAFAKQSRHCSRTLKVRSERDRVLVNEKPLSSELTGFRINARAGARLINDAYHGRFNSLP